MTPSEVKTRFRMRASTLITLAVIGVILGAAVAVAIPLVATSSPNFFSRYHLLERRYVNLENSAHEGIGCRSCHETKPVANGAALVADFYTSLVRKDKLPRYFKFSSPTRAACVKCHENDWTSDAQRTSVIPHPAHQRVASEPRDCAKCHKWTAHFESYMVKHEKMPFSGVCVSYGCHVGTKATEQCFNCHHILHESEAQWTTEHPQVVKATGQNACVESCHTVSQCQECHTTGKRPKFEGMRIETSMKSIEVLHVADDWTERYHGPEALKGKNRCLKCHQSSGECDECHLQRPAFHGSTSTWIGRHKKATKELDDPKCIACHKQKWCDKCHQQFKEME